MQELNFTEEQLRALKMSGKLDYILHKKCWFCQQLTADKVYKARVKETKFVEKTATYTSYKEYTFDVPRCRKCALVHSKIAWIKFWAICSFIIWWLLPISFMDSTGDSTGTAILISTCFFIVNIVAACIVSVKFRKKHPGWNKKIAASKYYDYIIS